MNGWLSGFAILAAATAVCFGLIVAGIISEAVATLLLTVVLFTGGRVMIERHADA